MDKLQKQPYEQFTIAISFSQVLSAAETIIGQSVGVTTSTGVDVTDSMVASGSVGNDGAGGVVAVIKGGDPDDSPHKLTARCETSLGHRWEHDIQIKVVDL